MCGNIMISFASFWRRGWSAGDRTGTGTLSVFGAQARLIYVSVFLCSTNEKLHLKSIIYELFGFCAVTPTSNISNEHGVSIWDEWADENGNLGPTLWRAWRDWRGLNGIHVDQIIK